MIPLGVAPGVLVSQAGPTRWWTPLTSGVVVAGSLQFPPLSLVTTGAPLTTIGLTTPTVNSRHVVYSLRSPLHPCGGARTPPS